MRELTMEEVSMVSGGHCESGGGGGDGGDGGNNIGGVTDSESLGQDLINIYEGLVEAASYVIERVADAIG